MGIFAELRVLGFVVFLPGGYPIQRGRVHLYLLVVIDDQSAVDG